MLEGCGEPGGKAYGNVHFLEMGEGGVDGGFLEALFFGDWRRHDWREIGIHSERFAKVRGEKLQVVSRVYVQGQRGATSAFWHQIV